MKRILLILIVSFLTRFSLAQKPSIDTSVLGKWPSVMNPAISNDGRYATYTILNRPYQKATFVVTSVDKSWKKEFIINEGWFISVFSANSKLVTFQIADSLYFVTLGRNDVRVLPNIASFSYPKSETGKWLAFTSKSQVKETVLVNLITGKQYRFSNVEQAIFNDNGDAALMMANGSKSLTWYDLASGKQTHIWSSDVEVSNQFKFDQSGDQLVFKAKKKTNGVPENSIWYYQRGMTTAVKRVDNRSSNIEGGIVVDGSPEFSKNGKWIFFQLTSTGERSKNNSNGVQVEVWSYKDAVIYPDKVVQMNAGNTSYKAVTRSSGGDILRLEGENEELMTGPKEISGDYVVVRDHVNIKDNWWQYDKQPSYYLVSLNDGRRKVLKKEMNSLINFSFSPKGKYLVYWDCDSMGAFYSCNLSSKEIKQISQSIPTEITSDYPTGTILSIPVDNVAGWKFNESALLIYDRFDIWEIDPDGKKKPVNLTNGFGRNNKIKLRLTEGDHKFDYSGNFVYQGNEKLILVGFNVINKNNGFYSYLLNGPANPTDLCMGPWTFFRTSSQKAHFYSFSDGMNPIKAKDTSIWIVSRQCATEAPNYYISSDFRKYTAISDVHPQKAYNWLKTELVSWYQFDSTISQGILYKPENFDSTKKYPVIFNFYEKVSHCLNEFPMPEYSEGNINIPWFVANGYLVITPDIYYSVATETNKTFGDHVYNSIVSAAQHLTSFSYIDGKKMALQGHSFGGAEVNCLITKTSLFAAASEAAGITDMVSMYLTLSPLGSSIEHFSKTSEIGQSRFGATLWQKPEYYLKSSAVIHADKITTPLLIMHNMGDNQIQWRQAVELYMALRRLGKKVWLLQYDNGDHGVGGADAVDYTIRLTQFFDHYLKGYAPPEWMIHSISPNAKGKEMGYELDKNTIEP